jgi:hypothetical protein
MRSVLEAPLPAERLRAGAARFDPKRSAARYAEVLGLNAPEPDSGLESDALKDHPHRLWQRR